MRAAIDDHISPGRLEGLPDLAALFLGVLFLVEGFFLLLTNADVLLVGYFLEPNDVAIYFATVKTLALVHFVYFAVKAGVAQRYETAVRPQHLQWHEWKERQGLRVAAEYVPARNGLDIGGDFGAVGDGETVNTTSIQKAIDTCANENGGTVLVPAGDFVTGTIELKSNITLKLENVPAPENPKTAWLACYSALAALKLAQSPVRYGT